MAMGLRASTASDANTYTSQKMVIDGLTYQPSTYYSLSLKNMQTGQTINAKVNGGGTAGAYYTTAFQFTGLEAGTRYQYEGTAKYLSSSAVTTVYVYFTTPTMPQTAPATPAKPALNGSANVYEGTQSFTIYYPASTDTIYIWRSWSSEITSSIATDLAGNFTTLQDSIPAGTHTIKTRAGNESGTSAYSTVLSFTMGAQPLPSVPTISKSGSASGSSQSFSIGHGVYTDRVYVDRSWSTETYATVSTDSASSFISTQSSIPVGNHTIRVRSYNEAGYSSYSSYLSFSIADTVSPTLTLVVDGYNALTATMTSSDNHTFRSPYKYSMYLDDVFYDYTNSNTFTYDRDNSGGLLKSGVSYKVTAYVYDDAGNSATLSRNVVVTRTRPAEMAWDTAKVAGANFKLTAVEWNRLTNRINEFRQYRGFVTLTFTTATVGGTFTATMYNQARNNIDTMVWTIAPPPVKNAGDVIRAVDIDKLRTSLNSIQ